MQLSSCHRMFKKANILSDSVDHLTPAEFQLLYNKYDNELVQLMHAAENKCRKIQNRYIPYSPVVGIWTKRLHIFRWIQRYKKGGKCNVTNLYRACHTNDIPLPCSMSLDEVQANEFACIAKLDELRKSAPELRVEHLQKRLDVAKQRKDDDSVAAIMQILKKEFEQKKNKRLHTAFGKQRGLPAAQLGVRSELSPDGEDEVNDEIFSERADVEGVAAEKLSDRFRKAHHTPVNSGKLLDEIGLLADTPVVRQILDGTFVFPPDWDAHTVLLMKEAAAIFKKTADDVVLTHVTTKDFQDWWLTANEDIQSSKSGCTFSHCKAAAHSSYLSALHCVKLNLALKTGTPLEHWGHGLTVLLEKRSGQMVLAADW